MSPSGDGWFGRPILRPAKEPPLPQIQHPAGHPRILSRLPVRPLEFAKNQNHSQELIDRLDHPREQYLYLIQWGVFVYHMQVDETLKD